jgi:hypothetical protein
MLSDNETAVIHVSCIKVYGHIAVINVSHPKMLW